MPREPSVMITGLRSEILISVMSAGGSSATLAINTSRQQQNLPFHRLLRRAGKLFITFRSYYSISFFTKHDWPSSEVEFITS
jgi:hypothetical protein